MMFVVEFIFFVSVDEFGLGRKLGLGIIVIGLG